VDPGPLSVQAPPAVDGAQDGFGWRTRVQVSVGRDGSRGLLRHRSHAVQRVRTCPITHPLIEAAGAWRADGPAAHRAAHQPRPRVAFAASATTGGVVVDGDGRLTHRALGHDFRVSGGGFWQVHPAAPELLASAVLDQLEPQPGERVLDLYAGAGLFSYALAARGARVTAVEQVPTAADDARVNCAGLPVAVVTGDVEAVIGELASEADIAVLDPPRTGAGSAVIQALVSAGPRAIAYVSCDGATLARDLRAAREAGYALRRLSAYDLFPMTAHLEMLALLEPAA
jgi:tRNA/tmRNA/rRNA uracil-C5-methylase (TrmA/RlmC/RlmD family)